jgi:glycosyltransferase involved in cell wall biosynthesis
MYTATHRKKILHLPKWYPHPADPQNGVFIQKQIDAIPPEFFNTVLFVKSAIQDKLIEVKPSRENGVIVFRVYFREYQGSKFLKPLVHLLRYLKGFRKGLKLVQVPRKPDLIHAHVLLRTGLLAWYSSRKFKCKYIVSEHWSGFITGAFSEKNFIYRKLSMLVLTRAERIILVSETLKSAFVKLGVPEEKIEIVPNVVEVYKVPGDRVNISIKNKVVMLSVADLVDDIKKISEVIEVVADLSKKHYLEYWIVGEGVDRQMLEDLAKTKGLSGDDVKFHGRKTNEEVLKIISLCDFLVLNSVTETFSVVAAEALLGGKPVVATRCGGPETFVNDKNGILIDVGNRQQLKDAIEKMATSYQSYNPKDLKEEVRRKFSAEVVGQQLKIVYNEVTVG